MLSLLQCCESIQPSLTFVSMAGAYLSGTKYGRFSHDGNYWIRVSMASIGKHTVLLNTTTKC
jgi:hypothetical protein